ncbi:hypothetical protein [Methylobacterium sp. Leaf106]|uniref:hypothetical protein n=1 Tax=Methylobacterium sp. Leaf106 TaxID=1736255 RepID=UPI0007014F57|nr:hypothetical protein [Methylobacterium sp. Leaf106]KQP53049.1 hypothetical protein ASF34_01380 [Methylobacterium sp. Leaf106]
MPPLTDKAASFARTETEEGTVGELSEEARSLCARWFGMSPRDVVTSHKPHKTMRSVQDAVDELVVAGIIVREPYNDFGSIQLKGSQRAFEIGSARRIEVLASFLTPPSA